MGKHLSHQEHSLLTWIAGEARTTLARRANVLLLWDQDAHADEIGSKVNLSQRRVRYWIRKYEQQGLKIFPKDILAQARQVKKVDQDQRSEFAVDELIAHFQIDLAQAQHVAERALTLFDLTKEIHRLPPARKKLLKNAALLHKLGYVTDPNKYNTVGRDLLEQHRLSGISDTEKHMLSFCIAMQRGRFKAQKLKREPSYLAIPEGVRKPALVLTALLRIAVGLDTSNSQTSSFGAVRTSPQVIEIYVLGDNARIDANCAQQNTDLWEQLFEPRLQFVVSSEAPPARKEKTQAERIPFTLPMKIKRPGIQSDDPMSEAGRKVLLFHFSRMLQHESGTRKGEDIEELHDMRVATRRMRSAFRVFGSFFDDGVLNPHLKGLRNTGRALGAVRDLDVFMEKAQKYLEELPEIERSSLDPLLHIWRQKREDARREMLAFLNGKQYYQFVQDFGAFLTTPLSGALQLEAGKPAAARVYQVAPELIYHRFGVLRGYDAIIENAPLETLHALRIDCKRFRYTLEFLQEALGPEVNEVIQETVLVQDHLGNLNDADVACKILIEFLEQWSAQNRRDRIDISGVTRYLVAKQNELRNLVETFQAIWENYNRLDVRRALALAVSTL